MSQVDRFDMAIEFLAEEEKADIYILTTELTNLLDSKTADEEEDNLKDKLLKFVDMFN